MAWSLVDLWFPGETDRAEELDRRNRELNARQVREGQRSQEWVEAQQARWDETGTDTYNSEIGSAAAEGAVEGLQELPGKVRGALSGVAGWSLSFIPWWGWLIGAGIVFGYLGGFTYARGILAKR